ncbi:MAG: uncharacterized protein PWP72_482 [Thermoanaerobacter sp.]|nr:uncharacterized protein [Thermoanaerobacter sp.]
MPARVFFADMRAKQKENLLDKVEKLFRQAGMEKLIAPRDLVAFKIHFGERGNTGYIRPQFIRRLVDRVKELGGKPFLTDANTLYVGSRSNAVDHLQTAIENGFAYAVVGAPLVIADGLTGKDYINVPVNLKHFKEVKIGSALVHADALLVVSHFKCHELTGFGGALKNIGMGSGARSGKQMMHSDVLPDVNPEKCEGCARCTRWCPAGAITLSGKTKKAVIDHEKCIGCGECTVTCPVEAIDINWKTEPEAIQEKIVEYAAGVLQNKKGKAGFINFVTNVSPECDCVSWTDAPIVRDIGILASLDPVALDQACADLVNGEKILPGSRLEGREVQDVFRALWPRAAWERQLTYGEEIGLGTREYELIKI